MTTKNFLLVRNLEQQVLFELELKGQLSDGHWENARPANHWEPWCDAIVEVAGDRPLGRTFHARKDHYALDDRNLLDVVGQRMIAYVRLARRFGLERTRQLEVLLDLDGAYRGIPAHEGVYWAEQRAKITSLLVEDADLLDKVQLALAEATYDLAALKRDLQDLKRIMRLNSDFSDEPRGKRIRLLGPAQNLGQLRTAQPGGTIRLEQGDPAGVSPSLTRPRLVMSLEDGRTAWVAFAEPADLRALALEILDHTHLDGTWRLDGEPLKTQPKE